MSGGSGSRLWPQSRSLFPKQFLPLINDQTMLQNTVARLDGLENISAPIFIANEEHRFLVAEQLRQMGRKAKSIILEPVGRNTAPAVALAALKVLKNSIHSDQNKDSILLVLAADHVIQDVAAFHESVNIAFSAAYDGKLVTFGVVPTHPETGYGYICFRHSMYSEYKNIFTVENFVEKPSLDIAKTYLASGNYYWNSGIFMFKASRYLEELKKFRPDILEACEKAIANEHPDLDFVRLDEDAFMHCPDDSIDYAVMEKTVDAVVTPLDAGWSDVGSWSSLSETFKTDKRGNVVHGDVMLHDTSGSYIRSEKKLIAAVGVDDLIITESDDAILVSRKDRGQDIKKNC